MRSSQILALIVVLAILKISLVECKQIEKKAVKIVKVAESFQPFKQLAQRILGERLASKIYFKLAKTNSTQTTTESDSSYNEYFLLSSNTAGALLIESNTKSGLSRGLDYFMKNYMNSSVSWNGDNIQKLEKLPVLQKQIRIQTPFQHRYMLNYCTYSYSMMNFWNWQRWERELDLMALQGINMPLAIIGTSKIWQNTLRQINYTESEILEFIPGPGFEAWWLMGNLEGYGGPVSQAYIDGQAELQQKILARMKEFGMSPILQGFYGMVPNSLKSKYPESKIYGDELWVGFKRPAFLDATDELFAKLAYYFYQESEKLYGRAKFYGGDPFHEGAVVPGLDLSLQAKSIYKAMQFEDNISSNKKVTWVLQSWRTNPPAELLAGLANDECIILDLMAEARSKWQTDDFTGHNFIWTSLPNFGMRIGQYGMIEQYVSQPELAFSLKNNTMKGIGSIPEGILTNVLDYDILFDLSWINIEQSAKSLSPRQQVLEYIGDFIRFRYGEQNNKSLFNAWSLLTQSIYNSSQPWDGPTESVLLARPAAYISQVSNCAYCTVDIYWNTTNVLEAWRHFNNYIRDVKQGNRRIQLKKLEEVNEKLGRSPDDMEAFVEIDEQSERALFKDTFLYDLVDLARQNLGSYSYLLHKKVMRAFNQTDLVKFALYSQQFLELIQDQDTLLSSRKEFMIGHYLKSVKDLGVSDEEKLNFIEQIKRQFTVWSDFPSDLHDYANKEWSGILKDFYLPRWELYFKSLQTYIIQETEKQKAAESPKSDEEESESKSEESHESEELSVESSEDQEVQEQAETEQTPAEPVYTKEDILAGKNIDWYQFEIQFSKNNIQYTSTPVESELEVNQRFFQKYYSMILSEHISINQITPSTQKQYGIRLQPKQHQYYTQFKFAAFKESKQSEQAAETAQAQAE